jgi:hypothetical protein
MTVTVGAEVVYWARRKAAEENTSVSKLVGQMLRDQMLHSEKYRRAHEQWNSVTGIPGVKAAKRLTRSEAHERRR